jgi:hypothetical protein
VELKNLIHAFNAMQSRIDSLLALGTQTMLAIGHDLRTPLARMQLRLDEADLDSATREAIEGDIAEMRDLLSSLQTFVQPGGDDAPAASIWPPCCKRWSTMPPIMGRTPPMRGPTRWSPWAARCRCAGHCPI